MALHVLADRALGTGRERTWQAIPRRAPRPRFQRSASIDEGCGIHVDAPQARASISAPRSGESQAPPQTTACTARAATQMRSGNRRAGRRKRGARCAADESSVPGLRPRSRVP